MNMLVGNLAGSIHFNLHLCFLLSCSFYHSVLGAHLHGFAQKGVFLELEASERAH